MYKTISVTKSLFSTSIEKNFVIIAKFDFYNATFLISLVGYYFIPVIDHLKQKGLIRMILCHAKSTKK